MVARILCEQLWHAFERLQQVKRCDAPARPLGESGLFVDRDLDTVYLVSASTRREPEIMSRMYQVGDAVEDILGNKTISSDERAEIAAAVGSLQTNSSELKGELERAFVETEAMRNYAKLREVIQDRLQDAYVQTQAVASLASKILYSYTANYSKDEFAGAIEQVIEENALRPGEFMKAGRADIMFVMAADG